MISRIRQVLIRITLPLSWRGKSQRIGATLRRFALIEADSGWQYLQAADALPEPAVRARMFLNALDEKHRAALFDRMAHQVDPITLRRPSGHRKALLTDPAELPDFLATIELGRHDLHSELESYGKASGDPRVAKLFLAMRDDPTLQAGPDGALVQVLGSREVAEQARKRARFRRLRGAWNRLGAGASEGIAAVLIGAVFFLAGPFFAARARARVAPRPLRAAPARPET